MQKKILVTGTSRGIGKAIAKRLLQEGYHVCGTCTTGKQEIDHPCFTSFKLDLSDPYSIESFLSQIKDFSWQHLINNAAILLERGASYKINQDVLQKTFQVNLFGLIQLCEALETQLNLGSHIINFSSCWGVLSSPQDEFHAAYKMSKAAVNMYTKILGARLAKKGITVSSIDPGWVKTDMGTKEAPKSPECVAQEIFDIITTKDLPSGQFWLEGKKRNW